MPRTHRMFLASPLPKAAAECLAEWAKACFEDTSARLTAASRLHVTFLFFGSVSTETKEELSRLVRQVAWKPLNFQVSGIELWKRRAIVARLMGIPDEINELQGRLNESTWQVDSSGGQVLVADSNEPLTHLNLMLPRVEVLRGYRESRRGPNFSPHVTLARVTGDETKEIEDLTPPLLGFALDRLVLYESILLETGPIHQEVCSVVAR